MKCSSVSRRGFLVAVRRGFEKSFVSCCVEAYDLKSFAVVVTISLDGFELEQLHV